MRGTPVDEVRHHLTALLTGKFEVPPEAVTDTATLAELDLDSLARVELVVTLQEEWGVPLDEDDDTLDGGTVGELLRRVHALLDAAPGAGDPDPS
ncbi:acyl carrier protein [Streptomyces sp. NPDC059247]|uniref:acyl carrier protein n=1 Tax=Streptomyces sp. NPDC059247 TaxID=3346790 RepID=UPI0036A085C0